MILKRHCTEKLSCLRVQSSTLVFTSQGAFSRISDRGSPRQSKSLSLTLSFCLLCSVKVFRGTSNGWFRAGKL
ncbi:hypothetical protein ASESINO_288 [Erwinia phage vB_EamM_Asesino]|uniref:Uncharacterized protein n=1 Tax=Erwinia phage vB_EamM_Asesino TaxID=1883370 RepID=A0A1B2IAM2_9CAUD|nr:hypothetical protein ASESINO_288 [Erwinia phage vB_EamM_Asesino]ANZ48301.1 hypothetical protein ASESINO_288 [Erwinia phage vB_EamM_Asesino]